MAPAPPPLHAERAAHPEAAPCPVWGTPARRAPGAEDGSVSFFSPRAGGAFVLEASGARALAALDALGGAPAAGAEGSPAEGAEGAVESPGAAGVEGRAAGAVEGPGAAGAAGGGAGGEAWRVAVSNRIVERRMRGAEARLDGAALSRLHHLAAADPARASGAGLALGERGDRLLLLLDALSPGLAEPVEMDEEAWSLALAWSSTGSRRALWFVLRDLERRGRIDLASRVSAQGPRQSAVLLEEGVRRVAALRAVLPGRAPASLFVSMWRGGPPGLFEAAVAPAAARAGLRAVRVDRAAAGDRPVAEALPAIRGARALLLEMTGDPAAMGPGGPWFEAGFAAGAGVPVLWSCRGDPALLSALELEGAGAPAGLVLWSEPAELSAALDARLAEALKGA